MEAKIPVTVFPSLSSPHTTPVYQGAPLPPGTDWGHDPLPPQSEWVQLHGDLMAGTEPLPTHPPGCLLDSFHMVALPSLPRASHA